MPEMANIAWLLQNLKPEFGPFMAQVTQSLRVNPKAYNWESLTANLLDEAKRLEVSSGQNSIQYIKSWKKKKAPAMYCKYCHAIPRILVLFYTLKKLLKAGNTPTRRQLLRYRKSL
jgi:hypothetical protein